MLRAIREEKSAAIRKLEQDCDELNGALKALDSAVKPAPSVKFGGGRVMAPAAATSPAKKRGARKGFKQSAETIAKRLASRKATNEAKRQALIAAAQAEVLDATATADGTAE